MITSYYKVFFTNRFINEDNDTKLHNMTNENNSAIPKLNQTVI